MRVSEAKELARRWVAETGQHTTGFRGAVLHGSINWLSEDAELSPTSDLDILVILPAGDRSPKLGKFRYQGQLLEASYITEAQIATPQDVLRNFRLVGSFRGLGTLADPTGWIAELTAVVDREYSKLSWVRSRCDGVHQAILNGPRLLEDDPFEQQVFAWLLPAGITAFLPVVAALKNPTVRRRYVAAREVLTEYGVGEFYASLLAELGCAEMTPERAQQHLTAMTEAFDAASTLSVDVPYTFASDLSEAARPIAVNGTREMIERGDHREAIFWLAMTYSKCLIALRYHEAPNLAHYEAGHRALFTDLGTPTFDKITARVAQTRAFLPQVREVAEKIMAANPKITDSMSALR